MIPAPDDAIPADVRSLVEKYRLAPDRPMGIPTKGNTIAVEWDDFLTIAAALTDRRNRPAVAGEVVAWEILRHGKRDGNPSYQNITDADRKAGFEAIPLFRSALASGQEMEPAAPVRVTDKMQRKVDQLRNAAEGVRVVLANWEKNGATSLTLTVRMLLSSIEEVLSTVLASAEPERPPVHAGGVKP